MTTTRRSEFDAIVVGTGPGGAAVAKELSARRRRVLILEQGGDAPVDDSFRRQSGAMRINFVGRGIPILKGVTLGGTSMLYCGCAFDPPVEMFRTHGIDLTDEIQEMRRELPIGPLPEHAIGPRAKRIMASARDLGYDWRKLNKFVYAEKCDSGMPYEAKWNARVFVREAQRNGAVLKSRARVRRVLIENNVAVGVEFVQNGSSQTAYAGTTIVAAGGIGSPILLRASGIKRAGEGFFCDPLILVNGAVEDIHAAPEAPMAAGIHLPDDGYMLTDLTQPRYLYWALTAEALRFDRLFAHSRTLSIMVKARDSIDGRITDSGRVRRVFSKEDIHKLKHGYARAKAILKHAGAKHIHRHWYLAAHPGGTVRVNDLLDTDLRTEHENLYVCDCSVIPEPWGLPPTFTLIALGKRLARHLTQGVA
jgi:choline dehydrogenase-like flavoprotein